MNLKHLTDKALLLQTKNLASKEREITTEVLHHLKEVEKRRLFSDLKYSSMMEYLLKELGYSEAAAGRRLQASRILKDIPEIEKKIKDGSLSLSNLNKAAGFFKREDIKDPQEKKEILKKIENQSARECEKTLFSLLPEQPLPKESIKVVSENYQQLKVNISDSTFKALNKVKDILGHHSINDLFLGKLSEEALENITRKKFKFAHKSRTTESDSRYVTNSSKREVYQKSNGVCENCGSLFMLQFDHREPFALGGKSEASNLRLLCFNCNQRARIRARL
jgi:hypothetical protein